YCSFFSNDTATTESYTLSLHDALPIYPEQAFHLMGKAVVEGVGEDDLGNMLSSFQRLAFGAEKWREYVDLLQSIAPDIMDEELSDRKSTRLNSSHVKISYAVFCLKKKK